VLVGNSSSGRQALKDIVRLSPDVVLADITITEMDGVALLRETRRLRRPPAVVICTRFCSEASLQCASRYGAAFFLCKPIALQTLPELLIECAKSSAYTFNGALDIESVYSEAEYARARVTRELFRHLGFPENLNGSAYIFETVVHLQNDKSLLKNMTHGLYAQLAARMNTTPERIERSLRNAIDIAYKRGSLKEFFEHKPTNREFLEYIFHETEKSDFPDRE